MLFISPRMDDNRGPTHTSDSLDHWWRSWHHQLILAVSLFGTDGTPPSPRECLAATVPLSFSPHSKKCSVVLPFPLPRVALVTLADPRFQPGPAQTHTDAIPVFFFFSALLDGQHARLAAPQS